MKKKKITRKETKKESFVFRNIIESWKYIKESRNFIYFSILAFAFFILFALIFPVPSVIAERIKELLLQLSNAVLGKNTFQLIIFIFFNNLLASAVGLFLGVIFGIFPFFIAIYNGYVLGYVLKLVVGKIGFLEIWKLFPHGIFELPAVFISLGLGIKLGASLFAKNSDKEFLRRLKNSARVFFFIVLPLLVIAAVIEGSLIKILG